MLGRLRSRAWGIATALWGAVTGAGPHVLHHVGPLAGAAFLSGATGKAVFFIAGLVLSLPMLRRLHRRTRTAVAPVLAVAAFAAMFTISTLVVAPLLADDGGSAPADPTEVEHRLHHQDSTDTLGGYPEEEEEAK